jgi:hypothetical protein
MQLQRDRLTNLMDSILGKIKLSDKVKGEASGPQLVYVMGPDGPAGVDMGWQFTVWLEHNKLLGQDPVGVTVPVNILLPSEDIVRVVTTRLLDEARKMRHQATETVAAEGKASMAEAMRQVGRT